VCVGGVWWCVKWCVKAVSVCVGAVRENGVRVAVHELFTANEVRTKACPAFTGWQTGSLTATSNVRQQKASPALPKQPSDNVHNVS